MSDLIRILIADDHPLFREGVAHSLTSEHDLTVVGQAGNGKGAVTLTSNLLPDVVLLDITMPGQGGIAAARSIAAACPSVRIVMLTVSEDEDDLMNALKAGACGYVLKGISARALANAVRVVANGDAYISPMLANSILLEMTQEQTANPLDELTEREREVLRLVGGGLTNREIGLRLNRAEKTIKHYMTNILQKLQVRSRVEAALLAQKQEMNQ
ncbi:MAG: response regulator [Anaerolineae bacterium]